MFQQRVAMRYQMLTKYYFHDQERCRSLMDIIFGNPSQDISMKDMREAGEESALYQAEKQERDRVLDQQYTAAFNSMAGAIAALPSNLYQESIQAEVRRLPNECLFHNRYRQQLMEMPDEADCGAGGGLSQEELKRLETFQNLFHIRYPYITLQRAAPQFFKTQVPTVIDRVRAKKMKKEVRRKMRALELKKHEMQKQVRATKMLESMASAEAARFK
eukprot:GHVN01045731.1.p1 GENE.GHVN01045731.1~~GHVN01045731.1.p1  ORF type:complete len:217 (+),score=40.43 GHVN01045731.1:1049-1699(+)